MTAPWLKKVKSFPAPSVMDGFGKNKPPAPWNMIQALKMCGLKFTHLVDTKAKAGGEDHGPRYLGQFLIEESTGSDMLISALMQGGYGNCNMEYMPIDEFSYVIHAGSKVSMQAVLDYGLEIKSAFKFAPDENDKTKIALTCMLPLETTSQHEMAQVILKDLNKGKKK